MAGSLLPPVPQTPTNLFSNPTNWSNVNLSWQDNSTGEAHFEIQRKKTGDADFSYLTQAPFNSTFLADHSFSGYYTYSYRVAGVNLGGMSAFTNIASASVPQTPPPAPTNLYAENPSHEMHVVLTWEDNANNETTYTAQRRRLGSGIWTDIVNAGPDSTSTIDRTAHINTYYYRIKASNPWGSSYSNTLEIEVIE